MTNQRTLILNAWWNYQSQFETEVHDDIASSKFVSQSERYPNWNLCVIINFLKLVVLLAIKYSVKIHGLQSIKALNMRDNFSQTLKDRIIVHAPVTLKLETFIWNRLLANCIRCALMIYIHNEIHLISSSTSEIRHWVKG